MKDLVRVGIIIQARMGSSRLPGKIFKRIGDKSLLDHVLDRLQALQYPVTETVVATSLKAIDDCVEDYCKTRAVECYRGSETNVLERYFRCATFYHLDHIIRLTADNPFTDIKELDRLIRTHLNAHADFTHSFAALPKGAGAEIFTFPALKSSFEEAQEPHHIEHVDEYLIEHPDRFKTIELAVADEKNKPEISLTVDTPEDLRKACFIVKHSKNGCPDTLEAIQLCSQFV